MVIKNNDMIEEKRENMRGGEGEIIIKHFLKKEQLRNSRLLAKISIPIGASIGDHQHNEETEYYIILAGEGIVIDDNIEQKVENGDIVVTGDGASHSIRNIGNTTLEMLAVIITY